MALTTMGFNQIATVLQAVTEQATGAAVAAPVDTGSFVSVAQTALSMGNDAVLNSILGVIGKTIFSVRPYDAKMAGLEKSLYQWGAYMRKLSVADKDWMDDSAYKYPVLYDAGENPASGDGESVDHWKIRKPEILQTNFVGRSVYMDHYTIFEDQLEQAFEGPDQFGSFISMITGNMSDKLEQSKEVLKRGLVANMIGSLIDDVANYPDRVVHLLTEYNAETGLSLTATTVYQPDNFNGFMKWSYARMMQVSDEFTERSEKYQTVVDGKHVYRHTPKELQRLYIYSPARHQMMARVLADTYHDNLIRFGDVESLAFWQSIKEPGAIDIKPAYTLSDGTIKHANTAVTADTVFGLLFDDAALGISTQGTRIVSTPLNASGLYRNVFTHAKHMIFQDNTEKACVFLLD